MIRDPLSPEASLLCKLGSIARHVEEGLSPTGVPADLHAAQALLGEPEVQGWMLAMDDLSFLPVKR